MMKNDFAGKILVIIVLSSLVILSSGCASRKPLHRELKTSEITVGIHAQESNGSSEWGETAAGKVAQSLQSRNLMDQAWQGTMEWYQADTYSLSLVSRDKINRILAEKNLQYEKGGYSQISEELQNIKGLNVMIFTKISSISPQENKYENESALTNTNSFCKTRSIYSILHVEAVRVDNGEIITTGEYEGTSSRTKCKSDDHPSSNAFNLERLKLESLKTAADKFSGEFRGIL